MTTTGVIRMKFTLHRVAAAAAAVGFLLSSAPLQAATDGTLGATSTGSVTVSVAIPTRAKITGLTDLAIGTYAGPSKSASDTLCVYSNTNGYSIKATSGNGTSSFLMKNGTDTVSYAVEWDDGSGLTALTHDTAKTGRATGGSDVNCSGGDNATLKVTVSDSDIGAAIAAATYTDTLTLLVTPE